jgi:hypothetical protein
MKQMTLAAAVMAVFVTGCGSKEETTIVGADGSSVTASKDGKSMTINTPDGTANIDTSGNGKTTFKDEKGNEASWGASVNEADLGVPFYPGSTEKPNESMTTSSNGKKSILSRRTTTDEPDKVIAFYKDKVKDGKDSTATVGDMKTAALNGKAGNGEVSVTATKQGSGNTDISIGYVEK